MKKLVLSLLCLFLTSCATVQPFSFLNKKSFGHFTTPVKTEWLAGRDMRLLEDVIYIDPDGKEWIAPKGARINGASIPKAFWSILGGPYEGKYRDASVIHDVECVRRIEPWQKVHAMFYAAMRAKGVKEKQAKLMYAAVYKFGPRWNKVRKQIVKEPSLSEVSELKDWVNKENPSLEKIETATTQP